MWHKHGARQPSGTRPPLRGTPTQAVANSRKTWQGSGWSSPSQAEGKARPTSHAHSQVPLPAQSSLFSPVANGARVASVMQERWSRSKHQLHGTGTDSQEPCLLAQGSLQLLFPWVAPAEKWLPITWRWGQWLEGAVAYVQVNGSARHHKTSIK